MFAAADQPSRRYLRLVYLTLAVIGLWAAPCAAQDGDALALLAAPDGASFVGEGWQGWTLTGHAREPGRIRFTFSRSDGEPVMVLLEPKDASQSAYSRSEHFNIYYKTNDGDDRPQLAALMDEVTRRVLRNDTGRLVLVAAVPSLTVPQLDRQQVPQGVPDWVTSGRYRVIDSAERTLAMGFLLLALVGLLWALGLALREVGERAGGERALWLVALLAALAIRLWADPRMVMTYSGYGLIQQAVDFGQLKKYGAGTPLLYALLLRAIPAQAQTVYLTANAVFGFLTVVLASAWAQRYVGGRFVGAATALVLALNPLLIKDHASESNLVPTFMFVMAGLLIWETWRQRHSRFRLVMGAAVFGFAILSRPLLIGLVPVLLLVFELQRCDPKTARIAWRPLLLGAALLALLLVPHGVFLVVQYLAERFSGHASGFAAWAGNPLSRFFSDQNLFLRYDSTPVLLPLLWAVALSRASLVQFRRLLAILFAAIIVFTAYFVDMPPPSLPRLEAPAMLLLSLGAALGLAILLESLRGFVRGATVVALAVAFVLTARPVVAQLWMVDNDLEEHRMLERAAAAIGEDAQLLGRLGVGDEPKTWGVFRVYPDYLFDTADGTPVLVNLNRLLGYLDAHRTAGLPLPKGVYVYLGMRCYALVVKHVPAHMRAGNVAPDAAGPDYQHPLCARIRSDYRLVPVAVEKRPNHEWLQRFLWYPPRAELELGLYKLVPDDPAGR